MKTGVYTITNIINNKIYVGSASVTFTDRFTSHKKQLKEDRHFNYKLQQDYNQYGLQNFKFEILEYCKPEFCLSTEQYWLNILNVCNDKYGYNILTVAGNNRGFKHTKEQKLKAQKNKKPYINKIYQYDLHGNFLNEYNNTIIASNKTKISKYSISMCIREKTTNAGGFQWKRIKQNKINPLPKGSAFHTKIYQYDLEGNFIKEWENLNEIILNNDTFIKTNIVKVLKEKRNSAHNFIWRNSTNVFKIIPTIPQQKRKTILYENNIVKEFNSCVDLANYLNICPKLCHAILKKKIKNSKKLNGKQIKYL